MTAAPVDRRAVAALADAIDAAIDSWDAGSLPQWAASDPDRHGLALAVASLLSQYGYTLCPLPPAGQSDPGYGLENSKPDSPVESAGRSAR